MGHYDDCYEYEREHPRHLEKPAEKLDHKKLWREVSDKMKKTHDASVQGMIKLIPGQVCECVNLKQTTDGLGNVTYWCCGMGGSVDRQTTPSKTEDDLSYYKSRSHQLEKIRSDLLEEKGQMEKKITALTEENKKIEVYKKIFRHLARRLQVPVALYIDANEEQRRLMQERVDLSIICDIMSVDGNPELYANRLFFEVEDNEVNRRRDQSSPANLDSSTGNA